MTDASRHVDGRVSAPAALQRGEAAEHLLTFRPSGTLQARLSEGAAALRAQDGLTALPPGRLRSGISSVVLVSTAGAARQFQGSSADSSLALNVSRHGEDVPMEVCSSNVHSWQATSALIIAEVVGTGVLALGGQMAVVGLPFGLFVLIMCYPLNLFTSLLLGTIHQALPGVVTLGDALDVLLGKWAGVYGYAVLYIYLFMTMANYMIVLADSVQSIVYWYPLCRPISCLVGAMLLIPSNQFRTLSGLSVLSVVSFATVLMTLAICLWTLLAGNPSCQGDHGESGYLQYSAAISGFIFAFAGQSIMLEMQAEMDTPAHFPRAVYLAFSIMLVVYLLVAVLSYRACGDDTPGELLLVLPRDWRKSCAGALMVVHLVVTYTILQQVFNRALCVYLVPGALGAGIQARVKWFLVSTVSMAACYGLANVIPLFEDVVNLTGSLLSTQCAFIAPGVLFLGLGRREHRSQQACLPSVLAALSFVVVVFGIYLAVTGTASSLLVIAQKLSAGGNEPFSCHALSEQL